MAVETPFVAVATPFIAVKWKNEKWGQAFDSSIFTATH
jgi:hypothetical protein